MSQASDRMTAYTIPLGIEVDDVLFGSPALMVDILFAPQCSCRDSLMDEAGGMNWLMQGNKLNYLQADSQSGNTTSNFNTT